MPHKRPHGNTIKFPGMPSPCPDGFNDRQLNRPGDLWINTISPTTFKGANLPDQSISQHLDLKQNRSSSKLLASSSTSPGIWRRLVYMPLQLPGLCLNPNSRKRSGSGLNIGRLPYPCNSRDLRSRFFKDFLGWLFDGWLGGWLGGLRSHLRRHLNRLFWDQGQSDAHLANDELHNRRREYRADPGVEHHGMKNDRKAYDKREALISHQRPSCSPRASGPGRTFSLPHSSRPP